MTPLQLEHSLNRLPLQFASLLIPLALACFALSPQVRATCQEGCLDAQNTVLGDDALISNSTGFGNTAIGFQALTDNTEGTANTAIGNEALAFNSTGTSNTAIGQGALSGNSTGNNNTAEGLQAMGSNSTGRNNTAEGFQALIRNTIGKSNTVIGFQALFRNTTGNSNISVGASAGFLLVAGSNNIYIGNPGGGSGESSSIRIGTAGTQSATFIAGISGATVASAVPVIVDTDGHLGTTTSSVRYKEAIQPMDSASEALLALKPVTFRYKHQLDPAGIPQFGLVAEEVEKVNPALVARDKEGKPYTVRYDAVNAMLLNEFLKEHRKVEDQQATITNLKSAIVQQRKDFEISLAKQQKQIEALSTGLQKLSVQAEISKAVLQAIANNQ